MLLAASPRELTGLSRSSPAIFSRALIAVRLAPATSPFSCCATRKWTKRKGVIYLTPIFCVPFGRVICTGSVASGILPPATLVHPCTSRTGKRDTFLVRTRKVSKGNRPGRAAASRLPSRLAALRGRAHGPSVALRASSPSLASPLRANLARSSATARSDGGFQERYRALWFSVKATRHTG